VSQGFSEEDLPAAANCLPVASSLAAFHICVLLSGCHSPHWLPAQAHAAAEMGGAATPIENMPRHNAHRFSVHVGIKPSIENNATLTFSIDVG
jgi:hypothetical protein